VSETTKEFLFRVAKECGFVLAHSRDNFFIFRSDNSTDSMSITLDRVEHKIYSTGSADAEQWLKKKFHQ
jgi:hypothetical protein